MSNRKLPQRILAMALAVVMVLVMMPITTMADVLPADTGTVIAAFENVEAETANQTVPLGTSINDLNLPDTLQALVQMEPAENKTNTPEAEPAENQPESPVVIEENSGISKEKSGENHSEITAATVAGDMEIPAEKSIENQPEAVEETVVDYQNSASADPSITQSPETPKEEGNTNDIEIPDGNSAAFAEDSKGNTENSVINTVQQEQINQSKNTLTIPVAWNAVPEFNGELEGVYVFTPVLSEQYILSAGVSVPQITVTVQDANMALRGAPVGSTYTVSLEANSAENINWDSLGEKLGDGTIKNGDTLKIMTTASQYPLIDIPASISDLTITSYSEAATLQIRIIARGQNMRLKLEDITLTAVEPAILFTNTAELVVAGSVKLGSNSSAIEAIGDLTISGSGNFWGNVKGTAGTRVTAVNCADLTINTNGSLTFNGGTSLQNSGGNAIECANFRLESGTLSVYGGNAGLFGNGNGGIGINCSSFTVNGESNLTARGGDSAHGNGGNGIHCTGDIRLEYGTITAFGGGGGTGSGNGDGGHGIYCGNRITMINSSNLTAQGGNCSQSSGGNGIKSIYFTYNSSGDVTAYGGDVYSYSTPNSKGIDTYSSIMMNGLGNMKFQDGIGSILSPVNTIGFSSVSGEMWNVNPAVNLITGIPSDLNIFVKSVPGSLTTVRLGQGNKPVITINTQPEDITVTKGAITETISVEASATENAVAAYQWFTSSNDSNSNGTAVSGANNALFTIPHDLSTGTYYYYCEVSAPGADSVKTDVVQVTVTLPPNNGPFAGGDGTEDSPYQIATEEQLEKLSEFINNTSSATMYTTKYYELTNDIDLSEYTSNGGWVPIGKDGTYIFRGHFDGKGHTITGLTINRPSGVCQGLFGSVYNGSIKNLGLVGVNVNANVNVGGLVGFMNMDGIAQNCYVTGSVTGQNNAGGLVGSVSLAITINNCYTTTDVSGSFNVGGLVGSINAGTLQNSYATGSINNLGQNTGGLAGYIRNGATLQNCAAFNTSVTGNTAGRVCGNIDGSTATGNVAAASMIVLENGTSPNIIGDDSDRENGVSKTLLQLCEESGFPAALTQNPWVYTEGYYPQINDTNGNIIAGQDLIPVIVPVTDISGIDVTATEGTDLVLTATVTPSNSTYNSIVWSIKNAGSTGAVLNGNTLSTTSAGTIIVTATIENGITANTPYTQDFTITVNVDPSAFKAVTNISGVATSATAGTDINLTGTVIPANATNKTIVWTIKSPGTTGATRTGNTLSTTAAGTVIVTATIANGASTTTPYTQDFTITVNDAPPAFVAVTDIAGVAVSATAGTDITLTGIVNPINATNKTITWSIKNAGTTGAALSGNILSATAAGNVIVTAAVENGASAATPYTQDFTIMVNEAPAAFVPVTGITGVAATATAGRDITLLGTVSPVNATNKTIAWSIKNAGTTGASLNGNILSARAAGTIIVTAAIENGVSATTPYTQDFTISVNAASSGGNGGNSGSSGNSGINGSGTSPVSSSTEPGFGQVKSNAVVDSKGIANISITAGNISDAIANARAAATQKGVNAGEITVVINVSTDGKDASAVTVNLPKTIQQQIINNKVAGVELAIDRPDITLGINLAAVTEINRQANADVQLTAVKINASKLGTEAKKAIGSRPVYDFKASYENGTKNVTNFGDGKVYVSIPYTPDKKEAVGYLHIVYVDSKGRTIRVPGSAYDANSSSLIFNTNHFSVYGISYKALSTGFTDTGSHWAKDAIDYVTGRGLITGITKTTFAPDTAITRGRLVTVLGRLASVDTSLYKTNSFTDVKDNSVYRPYIQWAYSKGILSGMGSGQFAPNKEVTREEIAVIFANFIKTTGYNLPAVRKEAAYTDASGIAPECKTAVTAMQQAGIIMGGTDNKFNPKANATRGEFAAMLHRFIKLTIDPATAQGWVLDDGGQYQYYKEGKVLTGWWEIDGKWYYFNTNGSLARNTKIDGYEIDENGVRKAK